MHGCNGKMGQVITGLIAADDEIEIVAGIDAFNAKKNTYPVYSSLEDCCEEADAIIDFANAAAVDALLEYSVKRQIPVIVCTTGLSQEQIEHIHKASEQVAVLFSYNMSLGINMLLKLLKEAAGILAPAGFDIEIVEKHHNQKVDAPSGTAIALANSINDAMGNVYEYTYDRSKERKKRDCKEIGLHAVRGGTIVGEHEVIFAGTDEVIEFKHTAYSKSVFGKGAVQAAKFIGGKPAGLYTMADVVG